MGFFVCAILHVCTCMCMRLITLLHTGAFFGVLYALKSSFRSHFHHSTCTHALPYGCTHARTHTHTCTHVRSHARTQSSPGRRPRTLAGEMFSRAFLRRISARLVGGLSLSSEYQRAMSALGMMGGTEGAVEEAGWGGRRGIQQQEKFTGAGASAPGIPPPGAVGSRGVSRPQG